MTGGLRLDGTMIPRRVKRMFDERGEPRDASTMKAHVEWRGRAHRVGLANISASGAMVLWSEIPHIGESVVLRQVDRAPLHGVVRWVRDDRVGIHFTTAGE